MLVDKNLHSECLETLHINDVVESSWCKFKLVMKSLYLVLHINHQTAQINM